MRVRVYTANNESENHVLESFYEGCPEEDKVITDLDNYEPSEVAVVFGTYKKQIPVSYRRGHVVHQQKAANKTTVILETGYINRGAGPDNHYAAGLNGLNGRADFRNENSPPDRVCAKLLPWRTGGDHILMCGQVPWDASVDHIDFIAWTLKTSNAIQRISDRPIVYRSHPLARTLPPYGTVASINASLQDDLKNCWAVVTFNSNSAVEAAIAGVPVIADDEGSMALPIASHVGEINNPKTPDRTQWLNNLCYAQWTPEEMRQGKAWDQLLT